MKKNRLCLSAKGPESLHTCLCPAHLAEVEGLGAVHAQVEAVCQLLGPPTAAQPALSQVLVSIVPEQDLATWLEHTRHILHCLQQEGRISQLQCSSTTQLTVQNTGLPRTE